MIQTLKDNLSAVGKPAHVFPTADGTRLLLLPYGARVLGLYPPTGDDNFYWTNPKLAGAATAAEVFARDAWHNTGGDRTWLTPELDIFFPDYPDTHRHWEPPQLDASDYEFLDEGWRCGMRQRMTLHFARPNRDVELKVSKWVSAAPNPLRYEQNVTQLLEQVGEGIEGATRREGEGAMPPHRFVAPSPTHTPIEYAGYSQRTTWEICGPSAARPVEVGAWNLIQLPHGGDLIVPTYCKTQPRILFGDIPADCLIAEDRLVRFRVCFPGEHKIAIRAAATTGRMGYLYPTGDRWSLVVRNFFVNPSGRYIDVPKDAPEDVGYSVHAVNVKSGLGDFCELEYHAPAIGQDPQHVSAEDESQVWAFRGPQDAIRTIARRLLGAA